MAAADDSGSSGPASTHGDPSVIQEAMTEVEPGDEVRLAIDTYEWETPLAVKAVVGPVEWDAAYGDDWLTHSLIVEGGRGATYELAYSSVGDESAACYRYKDGSRGDKRGTIEFLAPVRDPDSDDYVLVRGSQSGSRVYHRPDSENPSQPGCRYGKRTDARWSPKDPSLLGDDWELCSDCSDDHGDAPEQADEHTASDDEVELPDSVSASDVEQAAADNRTLGEVASELDLGNQRTRTILFLTGCYRQVSDVDNRSGGER